jgi:Fe-S cluster assembly iron-binding protein IscA
MIMLTVTTTAKDKLKETLQNQTRDPEVAIRVTSLHARENRLELVLDKEKKGDQVVASEEGIKVLLICSKLAQGLTGIVLDYKETCCGSDFIISKHTHA